MYAHVGINVTDLDESIKFYTQVFSAEPVKVRPDYARFLLEDPQLNFTLNLCDQVSGNQVSHFGLQVADTDAVMTQRDRLHNLGFTTRDEMNVTCCYAVQDKFWVHDPDGNEWEFFVPRADAPVRVNAPQSDCCSA